MCPSTGRFFYPRRSQRPPKPHEYEFSHLTLHKNCGTIPSPKEIVKSRFRGGWCFCTLFRWA
nr:MAG TPA: hypothetical protein [Caudoviricetes sp.]